eukprot:scaffold19235_cov126-Isochrysis_galbana.AAC.27
MPAMPQVYLSRLLLERKLRAFMSRPRLVYQAHTACYPPKYPPGTSLAACPPASPLSAGWVCGMWHTSTNCRTVRFATRGGPVREWRHRPYQHLRLNFGLWRPGTCRRAEKTAISASSAAAEFPNALHRGPASAGRAPAQVGRDGMSCTGPRERISPPACSVPSPSTAYGALLCPLPGVSGGA